MPKSHPKELPALLIASLISQVAEDHFAATHISFEIADNLSDDEWAQATLDAGTGKSNPNYVRRECPNPDYKKPYRFYHLAFTSLEEVRGALVVYINNFSAKSYKCTGDGTTGNKIADDLETALAEVRSRNA